MSKFIVTRTITTREGEKKTNFAGFLDRRDEEATKKFGGPFIDYAMNVDYAKKFDTQEEAAAVIAEISKQLPDAFQTHEVAKLKR